MEFMRILIGKAFGRDISYRKKKFWILDTLYIELKSIVKPESKVPKARPKGLGLTLKSHQGRHFVKLYKIPVLGLDIVKRQV